MEFGVNYADWDNVDIAAHMLTYVIMLQQLGGYTDHAFSTAIEGPMKDIKKVFASFIPPTGRDIRHVMCLVEKAGFEPRTLGTGAERATNCATAPVNEGHQV